MKSSAVITPFLAVSLFFFMNSAVSAREVLTNEAVENMVKAELGTSLIISKIKASPHQFDVSTEEILRLKQEGVSEEIIQRMIEGSVDPCGSGKQEPVDENEAHYQKAVDLMDEEKYNEAIQILRDLAHNNADIKYHFSLVDALLEKGWKLREDNDPGWEALSDMAQIRIKGLYRSNYTNPDYWILYAKFGGIIAREHEVRGGFKKVFFYKPYYVKALIEKGDVYYRMAKMSDGYDALDMDSNMEEQRSDKDIRARIAIDAYRTALISPYISPDQQAAVYFKLGELEMRLFNDTQQAVDYWGKAVNTLADSKWGTLSRERLNAYK